MTDKLTHETLRAWGNERLKAGEFYASDAADVDAYADAWEAVQQDASAMAVARHDLMWRIEALAIQHITDMAYIEAADETIAELRRRIEALEDRLSLCPSLDVAFMDYHEWREKTRALLAGDTAQEDGDD